MHKIYVYFTIKLYFAGTYIRVSNTYLIILAFTQPKTLLDLMKTEREDVQGYYDRFLFWVGENNPFLSLLDMFAPISPEVD